MYEGPTPSPAHATPAPRSLRRWLFRKSELAGMAPVAELAQLAEVKPVEDAEIALTRLVAEAEAALTAVSGLVVRTGAEARAYGDALESHADAIEASSGSVVAALAELTRTMVQRTRAAEQRMAAMGEEMAALQANLAEARDDAVRDALTGLPNRRALQDRLAALVAQARAAGAAVSVAFCDVDHFKAVNDTHGHDVGDRVLRLVADVLSEEAGDDCFVGRHGGEEFLMLFDGADAETAAARVDVVRENLAARRLRVRETEASIGRVTFSAGIACLRDGERDGDMLSRADAALYRAKENGRNRIETSD
jgi:diguanylate cyclase